MEMRLNKLMSDCGLCSRREADKFIEMGRVTVNGQQPTIGQKVTEEDIVLVDGEQIRMGKHSQAGTIRALGSVKLQNLVDGVDDRHPRAKNSKPSGLRSSRPSAPAQGESSTGERREHFGRYNKYAAARKAAKARGEEGGKPKSDKEKRLQEAMQPKFGRSLSRSAVAQRMAASLKSAALRKTSRNNPINKAKRNARREQR